ncbi:hypothetical protein C2W64_00359 [Brevibacillus laterosporus]|nr:hypothetical protein C2W64_00359 [Brevibacillus laterosporus]
MVVKMTLIYDSWVYMSNDVGLLEERRILTGGISVIYTITPSFHG